MIEEMEMQASVELAAAKNAWARVCLRSSHMGNEIELRARRLKNGRDVFGYSFCAVKLERAVLAQLLETNTTCPHCRQTQARWRTLQGLPTPTPKQPRESFQFRHLVDEIEIAFDGQLFIARPAVFQCLSPCAIGVHRPVVISKHGWDVFSNGKYVSGGVATDPTTGFKEPTFPSIEAVQAWVKNQATEGRN